MQVGFVDVGAVPDPCTPAARRGFLGAENETIQVRILSDTRFIWSFSNAAPLYRVTLSGQNVHLISPPRDALLRPLIGDVIELIRCDAILPNGEMIGERHGLFFRVKTSFDPGSGIVALDDNGGLLNPGPFPNETTLLNSLYSALALDHPFDGHFYARVWRGETIAASPPGKAFTAGTPVQLGNTGLTVTFTGNGPVGDAWTFSVRPNTPELIAPWGLTKPSPPTGPRRHIAGLGLIRWDGTAATPIYTDCRRRVRKLENASGCCEVTVGDNQESFGDVSTIADALALLPPSGGKICLLRGTFTETVKITHGQNIIIEGCGKLTRLSGAAGNTHPVIGLKDCENILVRGFAIDAPDRIAIAIDDSGTGDFGETTRAIRLDNLAVASRDAPAVVFNGGDGLRMTGCDVALAPISPPTQADAVDGMACAVLLFGANMLVEGCRIEGRRNEARVDFPVGGIQVLGGSQNVELRRNRIANAAGTGIVLGSVTMVPEGTAPSDLPLHTRLPFASDLTWAKFAHGGEDPEVWIVVIWVIIISADGCTTGSTTIPGTTGPTGKPMVPDADPFILDCRIIDNDIVGMGECGIGPFTQFDLSRDQQLCGVSGLEIRHNRIRGCLRNEPGALKDAEIVFTARGGVVLGWAEELDVVDNVIEYNGTKRNTPVCGFFAAGLSHARFARNRIHDNGMRLLEIDAVAPPGQRGGIVIRGVSPASVPFTTILPHAMGTLPGTAQTGRDSLVVQGNDVSAPEGRALQVQGIGAMSITGNQLASLGAVAVSGFWQAFGAIAGGSASSGSVPALAAMKELILYDFFATIMGNAVVSVVNGGISSDIYKLLPGFYGIGTTTSSGGNVKSELVMTTGRVLFNANQTRFDGLALPISLVPVLVGIVSLDDVTMTDNQCDADFLPLGFDWPIVHGCALALTLRFASNRFSEPDIDSPTAAVKQLSGLCVGVSVMMHHNFGSHCFLGLPTKTSLSVGVPNFSLIGGSDCKKARGTTGRMMGAILDKADSEGMSRPDSSINERYRGMVGREMNR